MLVYKHHAIVPGYNRGLDNCVQVRTQGILETVRNQFTMTVQSIDCKFINTYLLRVRIRTTGVLLQIVSIFIVNYTERCVYVGSYRCIHTCYT